MYAFLIRVPKKISRYLLVRTTYMAIAQWRILCAKIIFRCVPLTIDGARLHSPTATSPLLFPSSMIHPVIAPLFFVTAFLWNFHPASYSSERAGERARRQSRPDSWLASWQPLQHFLGLPAPGRPPQAFGRSSERRSVGRAGERSLAMDTDRPSTCAAAAATE